ncbi:MAG: hypothetical protein ABI743_03265, partial [bacterium]
MTPASDHDRLASSPLPLGADPAAVGLAIADLHLDLLAETATLTPQRDSAAIGDIYSEIGLTPAFNQLFGDHFQATGVRKTGPTTVEVDFIVLHPFSRAARPDLAIFNLKLWLAIDRPSTTVGTISSVPGVVTNADGYGRMWVDTTAQVPVGSTPAVQPYIVLHEDRSNAPFDWRAPAGFNVLPPGQSSLDTLALDLGPGANTLDVRVFLTADYGQSAVRATRQNPQYSLPGFAGNAPWKIGVTELSNTLEESSPTSSAEFQVEVWDWKHGQGLNSDVTGATLTLPGIAGTTPLDVALTTGNGQGVTPLTGAVIVTNSQNATEGDYWGLVTVSDSATGIGLKDDLATPIAIDTYQTFQWFRVHVGATVVTDPPVAVLTRGCPGLPLALGDTESFDGLASVPGSA